MCSSDLEINPPKKKFGFKEKREFDELTKALEKLNQEKENLSQQLSSGSLAYPELERISSRFKEIAQEIDIKEMRWLELSELI